MIARRPSIFALVAFAANSIYSLAQGNVLNQMAGEMTECAAYFSIVSVAMENSKKPDDAKKWSEVSDQALEKALIITKEAGLKPETVEARYGIALDDMSKRIDKNTSNISILMADYNDLCLEVMNDSKKRMEHWLERELAPPPR